MQTQCACGFNCGYCAEYFRSISSPHRWTVWVGCVPLDHTDTAQCSIGPVHWAAALFKFRWNYLCSYCSITNWQHRSDWYIGALYTELDESSRLATAEISKVNSNIIILSTTHTIARNFLFTETSHLHHKSRSPKAHYNSLHPPVNLSILPPNISLSTTFLNSSLQSNK